MSAREVTSESLATAVSELVQIPSVNPLQCGLKSGDVDEARIAQHIADRLTGLGAHDVELDDISPGRPNVLGFVEGHTDRLVVLDVHTDTVSVEHMTEDPFDGRIENGHVWGRGALDTKASMGVMLDLLDSWRSAGIKPTPTLLVLGTCAEEAGGLLGAVRFRQWATERGLEIDQIVAAEPTQLAPIHGHKGATGAQITVMGEAAHSSLPDLGRNAIEAMAPVISALVAENERITSEPATTELGTGTLSVTMIDGGTGPNIIPDRCSILAGRRLVPGEIPVDEFDRIAAIATEACPLPVEVEGRNGNDRSKGSPMGARAFYIPADSPLVTNFAMWAGTQPMVAPFGTNALAYTGLAKEAIVFGPGAIDDAHQATECVRIDDLVTLADVYTRWLEPH